MSTEYNPMEGLLADLLSTWDEEPASVPEGELSVPRPVMVQAPDMVAEVKDPGTAPPPCLPEYLPKHLPEHLPEHPPETTPVRFVSALTKPVPREPIFLDAAEVKATQDRSMPGVDSSSFVLEDSPLVEFDAPSPVVLPPEETAITILPLADRIPVWSEDAGAAAACAAILARMEREFAEREPVVLPARRTRLGSDAPRYVVFAVREMLFAVPIGRVLETDRMTPITPLPGAAAGVKGLTNLRGNVVPVIDLRDLLGWAPPDNPTSRRMLVIQDGNRQPLTALLVDRVKGLAAFPVTAWKSAAMAGAISTGSAGGAEGFVEAVTEQDGEWVSRLNLDRVLNETHLPSLAAA